jgi:hypothetical protein
MRLPAWQFATLSGQVLTERMQPQQLRQLDALSDLVQEPFFVLAGKSPKFGKLFVCLIAFQYRTCAIIGNIPLKVPRRQKGTPPDSCACSKNTRHCSFFLPLTTTLGSYHDDSSCKAWVVIHSASLSNCAFFCFKKTAKK